MATARKTTETPYAAALATLRDAELRLTDSEKRLATLRRQVARDELRAPAQDTPPAARPAERDRRLASLRALRARVTEAEKERDAASVALDQAGQAAAAALRLERFPQHRAACAKLADAVRMLREAVDWIDAAKLNDPPRAAGRSWSIGFPTPFGFGPVNEKLQTLFRAFDPAAYRRWLASRGLLDEVTQ